MSSNSQAASTLPCVRGKPESGIEDGSGKPPCARFLRFSRAGYVQNANMMAAEELVKPHGALRHGECLGSQVQQRFRKFPTCLHCLQRTAGQFARLRENHRGIAVPNIPGGSLRVARQRRWSQLVAVRDLTVLCQATPGTPPSVLDPASNGPGETGTINTGLSSADDPDRLPRICRPCHADAALSHAPQSSRRISFTPAC